MRTRRPLTLLAAAVLATSAAAPSATGAGAPSAHSPVGQERGPASSFEFGVIGDVPYGEAQVAQFPAMMDELSAQNDLEFLAHVGDVKSGSSECSDEYFAFIHDEFTDLEVPLVFTPGDNDWTDCHRQKAGQYDPLERLAALREMFFADPDHTLGEPMRVDSQDEIGLPENARFRTQRVEFGTINVQGSQNSTAPWEGRGQTEPTEEQLAEVAHRDEANATLLREMFDDARRTNARGVVIFTQADMFLPDHVVDGVVDAPEDVAVFQQTVQTIAEQSRRFDGEVYLINGDSHEYNADDPLAAGSPWVEAYGVEPVENLRRVTVEGDADSNEWTRFSVAPMNAGKGRHADQDLLSWERVPYKG